MDWDSALLGDGGAPSTLDFLLIGGFLFVLGYLIRVHRITGFITWTSPERAGVTKETLTDIVGRSILVIGGVTFLAAGAVAAGLPLGVIEPLYYAAVIVVVAGQFLTVRAAGNRAE